MKNNDLQWPGKQPYNSPVSQEFALSVEKFLCASDDYDSFTEEWEEVDLSLF